MAAFNTYYRYHHYSWPTVYNLMNSPSKLCICILKPRNRILGKHKTQHRFPVNLYTLSRTQAYAVSFRKSMLNFWAVFLALSKCALQFLTFSSSFLLWLSCQLENTRQNDTTTAIARRWYLKDGKHERRNEQYMYIIRQVSRPTYKCPISMPFSSRAQHAGQSRM